MLWVRFIDDVGNRLGDREMPEAPQVGDDVDLGFQETSGYRRFRVVRRLWVTDYPLPDVGEKKHLVIILGKT